MEPVRALRDWVLFRGSPTAAVHRITGGSIKTEDKSLPGRVASLAILFVTLDIASISSG